MRTLNWKSRLTLAGIMLTFVLSLAGSAFAGGPATFEEAKALAAQENKVLVLDFYTDW